MARIDGEELALGKALVLAALAHAVSVGGHKEERLVLAELLGRALSLGDNLAVLEEPVLKVGIALCELGLKHDLGVSVGPLAAHDGELLGGNACKTREVVGKGLRDGASGNVVRLVGALQPVDGAGDLAARGENALGTHELGLAKRRTGVELVGLVVVELDDMAVAEVLEDRRFLVVGILGLDGHRRITDLHEQIPLELILGNGSPALGIGPFLKTGLVNVAVLVRHALFEHVVGDGGHDGRVRMAKEHDLIAHGLAFALGGDLRMVRLQVLQMLQAMLALIIHEHARGVLDRPVLFVDEAGLHAVALELVKQHGIFHRSVDAHSDTEAPLVHAVGN